VSSGLAPVLLYCFLVGHQSLWFHSLPFTVSLGAVGPSPVTVGPGMCVSFRTGYQTLWSAGSVLSAGGSFVFPHALDPVGEKTTLFRLIVTSLVLLEFEPDPVFAGGLWGGFPVILYLYRIYTFFFNGAVEYSICRS
jgi:hypothetical protein